MARRHLDREQVKKAERPAWAGAAAGAAEEFYYDGIHFWLMTSQSRSCAVREDETPFTPWRHRDNCNCPLCVAAGAAAGEAGSATGALGGGA